MDQNFKSVPIEEIYGQNAPMQSDAIASAPPQNNLPPPYYEEGQSQPVLLSSVDTSTTPRDPVIEDDPSYRQSSWRQRASSFHQTFHKAWTAKTEWRGVELTTVGIFKILIIVGIGAILLGIGLGAMRPNLID